MVQTYARARRPVADQVRRHEAGAAAERAAAGRYGADLPLEPAPGGAALAALHAGVTGSRAEWLAVVTATRAVAPGAHWSAGYVGLPYFAAEFDCAHLVERVRREVFGQALALPAGRPGDRARELGAHIRAHLPRFVRARGPEDPAAEGDLVLMVGAGYLDHVGVVAWIGGEVWVLHNFIRARQVVLQRARDLGRVGLTVEGFYQWI